MADETTPIVPPVAAPAPAPDPVAAFNEKFARVEEQNQTLIREMNKLLRERADDKGKLSEREVALNQAIGELSRVSRRPSVEQEIQAEIDKARAAEDPVRESIMQSKLATAQAQRAALESIHSMAGHAAMELSRTLNEDERVEFFNDIFPNGNPNEGFADLNVMQNFGRVGVKMCKDAKARVLARRVESGEYAKTLEQQWTSDKEKRDKELALQAGITAGGTGVPGTKVPDEPVESYEDRTRREIIEQGAQFKMKHPTPK